MWMWTQSLEHLNKIKSKAQLSEAFAAHAVRTDLNFEQCKCISLRRVCVCRSLLCVCALLLPKYTQPKHSGLRVYVACLCYAGEANGKREFAVRV